MLLIPSDFIVVKGIHGEVLFEGRYGSLSPRPAQLVSYYTRIEFTAPHTTAIVIGAYCTFLNKGTEQDFMDELTMSILAGNNGA